MTREQMVQYISRFNIAPISTIRAWDEARLENVVAFIKGMIFQGKSK
jgi:hypothetical protein